jgi:3-carboxy-cis,cis-muconate cycloisomerase
MGRTFLQHARPTTFGLTTATWLSSVDGHRRDLRQIRDNLPLQLGGSTGTLSGYGDLGLDIRTRVASRLRLQPTAVPWHVDRTPILTIAHGLGRLARTMAKVATDVALLASTEVGEISVRSGGSSSMPDKDNPIDSVRAIAAAAACSGAVAMLSSAPPLELERGVGGWHLEWMALPIVFQTAGATAEAMRTCLQSLQVDGEAMASRVESTERAGVIAGAGPQIDRLLEQSKRGEDFDG